MGRIFHCGMPQTAAYSQEEHSEEKEMQGETLKQEPLHSRKRWGKIQCEGKAEVFIKAKRHLRHCSNCTMVKDF